MKEKVPFSKKAKTDLLRELIKADSFPIFLIALAFTLGLLLLLFFNWM